LKTEAFWEIANSNRSAEETELAEIIELLGNPDALTLEQIMEIASGEPDAVTLRQIAEATQTDPRAHLTQMRGYGPLYDWLEDRKNRRSVPRWLGTCGYGPARNKDANDGLWVINGRRRVVYVKKSIATRDTQRAGEALAKIDLFVHYLNTAGDGHSEKIYPHREDHLLHIPHLPVGADVPRLGSVSCQRA
jgi:hypothetical protein